MEARENIMWLLKRSLLVVLGVSLIFSGSLFAQAPDVLWSKSYGDSETDWGNDVRETPDGGFITVGRTASYGQGGSDIWLIRTNSDGDTLWTRTFGGEGEDEGQAVRMTGDGGFVITGWVTGTTNGHSNEDLVVIKTDSTGNLEWQQELGGRYTERGYDVLEIEDGYTITGHRQPGALESENIWLVRISADGDSLWSKMYGGEEDDRGTALAPAENGGVVITGRSWSLGGESADIFMIKTDSSGEEVWTSVFGGTEKEWGTSIQQTTGGYVVTGWTWSQGAGLSDMVLIRTDLSGHMLWQRTFGGPSTDRSHSVYSTDEGGFILAGTSSSYGELGNNLWVVRTDYYGKMVWSKVLGGAAAERGYAIRQTSNGSYLVAGRIWNGTGSMDDAWLVHLAADNREVNPNPDLISREMEIVSYSQDSLTVEFNAANVGLDEVTAGQIQYRAYYSQADTINQQQDTEIGSGVISLENALGPGESVAETVEFAYPGDFDATPYLSLRLDADNAITEMNETNNTGVAEVFQGPEIQHPNDGQHVLFFEDTTSTWNGVMLRFSSTIQDTSLIDFAYSVDDSSWIWTDKTFLYLHPDLFTRPGDTHTIRVTWGIEGEIIDSAGDSVQIHLVRRFTKEILVIDGTEESEFPQTVNATDSTVDAFYGKIFDADTSWDYYENELRGQAIPTALQLSQYRKIVWHADNVPAEGAHTFGEHTDALAEYLDQGGTLIVSGWRVMKGFRPDVTFPVSYRPGSFVDEYLNIQEADESPYIPSNFVGAGGTYSLEDVDVDSLKLNSWPYSGALSQINIFTEIGKEAELMYYFKNKEGTAAEFSMEACGILNRAPDFRTVTIGFPLYMLEEADAQKVATQIFQRMEEPPTQLTEEQETQLPEKVVLKPNYPNPFNPQTTIQFQLPEAAHASLAIYNSRGQEVRNLVDSQLNSGIHFYTWNGETRQGARAASGIYFYKLVTADVVKMGKMVLLK